MARSNARQTPSSRGFPSMSANSIPQLSRPRPQPTTSYASILSPTSTPPVKQSMPSGTSVHLSSLIQINLHFFANILPQLCEPRVPECFHRLDVAPLNCFMRAGVLNSQITPVKPRINKSAQVKAVCRNGPAKLIERLMYSPLTFAG